MLQKILDDYPDNPFLKADGFDEAVIGVDAETFRLIYSVTACIYILMKDIGMNDIDAWEYFEYNVRGSFVGPQTPIWCDDDF